MVTLVFRNRPRTAQERDQVRRFITLIDALYESHAKVALPFLEVDLVVAVFERDGKEGIVFLGLVLYYFQNADKISWLCISGCCDGKT